MRGALDSRAGGRYKREGGYGGGTGGLTSLLEAEAREVKVKDST